jgi:glutamine synthetase
MKYKYEYIWLDGYKPEPNLRSKTKIMNQVVTVGELPRWNFDGSSTMQAEGKKSDCILQPIKMVTDPQRENSFLVLCEVLNPDGTPHETNTRSSIDQIKENWWGFEQEYVLYKNGLPLGFSSPNPDDQAPQGKYYCGVGSGNAAGREIVEAHLDCCLNAGLGITGINAEVLLGQWEFQIFGQGKDAADQLWIARYILNRIAEKFDVQVNYLPKPLSGDWNGSGLHTNFSTVKTRESGDWTTFEKIFDAFEKRHKEHMECYGSDNDKRLTGLHETQHIDKFSYGVSDRGASIRIPQSTMETKKGYLEDRRPAANADPYRIIGVIQESLKQSEE